MTESIKINVVSHVHTLKSFYINKTIVRVLDIVTFEWVIDVVPFKMTDFHKIGVVLN